MKSLRTKIGRLIQRKRQKGKRKGKELISEKLNQYEKGENGCEKKGKGGHTRVTRLACTPGIMDVLHGRGFRETRAVHARIHARSIVCSTDGRTDKRMGDCYTQLSLVVRGSSKVANRAPLCTVVIRDLCWINCRPARKYSDSPVGKQRRYFTISSRLSPDIVTGRRRLRAVSKPWQAWPR